MIYLKGTYLNNVTFVRDYDNLTLLEILACMECPITKMKHFTLFSYDKNMINLPNALDKNI